MKISVVLPTYNRADTLRRALCSVLGQSERPHEVLVIDDGSTDSTAEIVKAFPAVRYVRLDGNRGAAHARNFGASLAQGDWVAFIDSDDLWLTDRLERQVCAASRNSDVDLWCSGVLVQRQSGCYELHQPDTAGMARRRTISQLHVYPLAPSTWLIRKSCFDALGGFDETMPSSEDWDLLVRIAAAHRLDSLDDPLVVKYNRADSLDADPARKLQSYGIMFERYQDQWRQDPHGRSVYLEKSAHAAIQLGDFRRARKCLGPAVKAAPLAPRRWAKWLLCLLLEMPAFAPLVLFLWPSVAREVKRARRA